MLWINDGKDEIEERCMTNIVSMPITHQVELDDVFFEDIICTMFEGGSNYWVGHIKIDHPDGDKPIGVPASTWISGALNKGGKITVFVLEGDESVVLVKNMIVSGLSKWAENYQNHVSIVTERGKCMIDAGDIDADDADIIFQYALFNDVVFG